MGPVTGLPERLRQRPLACVSRLMLAGRRRCVGLPFQRSHRREATAGAVDDAVGLGRHTGPGDDLGTSNSVQSPACSSTSKTADASSSFAGRCELALARR